jgi:hypothetical protein
VSAPALRFALAEQLALPCTIEQFVAGRLHADGRRYLPGVVLRLQPRPGAITHLSVVDRHHVVDATLAGQAGQARIVLLLSRVRLQHGTPRQGLFGEQSAGEAVSTSPRAYGRILAVPTWELQRGHLPYESLYTELLLDVGQGTVGVRTSATAPDLAAQLGKASLEAGDWIEVARSRIDILGFERADP